MIIKKKRVRSLKKYLIGIRKGEKFVIGLPNLESHFNKLIEVGFSPSLCIGETVLPKVIGPVSKYNAEGDYIRHTDQPMETAYRQVEWSWEEWRGPYKEKKSKIVDVPYKRYPRTFVVPPSIELTIASDSRANKVFVSPPIKYVKECESKIIHIINLFLEIFGEAHILRESYAPIISTTVKRLNWHVLPQGRMPWKQLRENVEPIMAGFPTQNQIIIEKRLQKINRYEPEFLAVGQAGFNGYLIFGFPKKNIYILESMLLDNATYVFEENWEKLSALTKAEILDTALQKERIIHVKSWFKKIDSLMAA